jgi:hypothetical protein
MSTSVAATVHEVKWRARRNRCLEARGVRRLNAQSPSELRWRLRVPGRATSLNSCNYLNSSNSCNKRRRSTDADDSDLAAYFML